MCFFDKAGVRFGDHGDMMRRCSSSVCAVGLVRAPGAGVII